MYFAVTTALGCAAPAQKNEANLVAVADATSVSRTQMVSVEGLPDTRSIIWVRGDCVGRVSQALYRTVFG
jgi:hypothetical protein